MRPKADKGISSLVSPDSARTSHQKWPQVLLKDEFLSCLRAFALDISLVWNAHSPDLCKAGFLLTFSLQLLCHLLRGPLWNGPYFTHLLQPITSLHLCPSLHIPIFVVQLLSGVRFFVTTWTAAHQASCPSLSPGVCSNSCPLSWWGCLTILASITLFSFCLHIQNAFFPLYWCIYLLNVCFPHWHEGQGGRDLNCLAHCGLPKT